MSSRDPSGRRGAIGLLVGLGILALLIVALAVWGVAVELPKAVSVASDVFSPGLGLKGAAIIAAGISLLALVVLALAAGDGIVGELHLVLPGFFVFFLFFWLMAAWVF